MGKEKEFGEYLSNLRKQKHLGVNQLAQYSGVSSSQISRIESGKRGVPKPDTISKLAKALKVPFSELMNVAGYTDYIVAEKVEEYKTSHTFLPILGNIRAGQPLLMNKEYDEYEAVETSVLKGRDAFVLRVQGDSMSGDRIYNGDKVVVVVQNFVEPHEIAVVSVNGEEATLKRVKCQDGVCMLIPSNPDMQPQIYPANEIHILGKVIESRRVHE